MSAPHNPERGEVALTLNGRGYKLRPSFSAIVAIETETGKSLVEIATMVTRGIAPLSVLTCVVRQGLIAAGERPEPTRDAVMGEVYRHGIASLDLVESVTVFLLAGLNGGVTPEDVADGGKPEAAGGAIPSPSAGISATPSAN